MAHVRDRKQRAQSHLPSEKILMHRVADARPRRLDPAG